MQIVKGDRNSQLRKDERTHLRKNASPRNYASKAKNVPQSRVLLRWGKVVRNTMAGRRHGCSDVVSCNIQLKEETAEIKREKTRTRCQGPARGQNTNDDELLNKINL